MGRCDSECVIEVDLEAQIKYIYLRITLRKSFVNS